MRNHYQHHFVDIGLLLILNALLMCLLCMSILCHRFWLAKMSFLCEVSTKSCRQMLFVADDYLMCLALTVMADAVEVNA